MAKKNIKSPKVFNLQKIKITKKIESHLYNNLAFYTGLLLLFIIYLSLYRALGQPILSRSSWNSYTLQAQAWWEGRYWLNENYSYLELALFNGKVFVSFPPIPSTIIFLLIPIFGTNVPDNFLTSLYMLLSFIFTYKLCRNLGKKDWISAFWSLFLVAGNNIFAHSVNGGVWFQAQSLSFLLSVLALYFIIKKKHLYWHFSFLFWALSIGCRPLQVVFLPILLYVLYQNISKENPSNNVWQNLLVMMEYAISPLIVGLILGFYNFIRFGNPFEFGHKYLKEFLEAPKGQFNLSYLFSNIKNIFRLPTIKNGSIIFSRFDGWAFYIANPLYIIFFIQLFKNIRRKVSLFDIIIFITLLMHISLTLLHKTLGGWQFGIRYLADSLPFLLFYIIYKKENPQKLHKVKSSNIEILLSIILAAFGIALNIYGSLWLFLGWS